MRTFIRFALALIIFLAASCVGDTGTPPSEDQRADALVESAGDHSMALMLPFPAGETRVLTRSYLTPETHVRHAVGEGSWDDSYALDFAGDGCGSTWGTPVLAAAAGVVAAYPLPGSEAVRERLDLSYGPNQVFIDHGNGCYSHYGHLASRTVAVGQRVQQGEQIGTVGNLGNVISACHQNPQTDGAHLHFKLFCGDSAIVPEPISGYSGLGAATGARLSHQAFHHAVGTLVKAASAPEIYQVCAADTLCHIRDETVYRSYRFWQDQSREWDTVVTVSEDELACHSRGLDLDRPVQLAATTCLDGGSWPTFVTFDDGVATRWRRRVPFAPNMPEYAILLRSWGFRVTDVLVNGRTCAIPYSGESLPLRDGTVVEQSSDSDFYVVSDDGTAYRLYRNLLPVLYGRGWPQVIQVPDGSVPSLVRRMDSRHREFTVTDATTCPNGSRKLTPSGGTGTSGGGASETPPSSSPQQPGCTSACTTGAHACMDALSPAVCVAGTDGCTHWSVGSCNDGFACNAGSGQCEQSSPAPTPTATPPPATSSAGAPTLTCTVTSTALRVTVHGLAPMALVDAAALAGTDIAFVAAGGDGGLSWTPSSAAQPRTSYAGGGTDMALDLPLAVTRFNFWVWSATQGRAYWLDLSKWSASGSCRIADDGMGGKVLLR